MTITVQNASEIKNAQGLSRNKNAKPVICLDTGEVFASATDAAEANGVTIYAISTNCLGKTMHSNGKRFCYIKDVNEHLDELTTVLQNLSAKANKYDALMEKETEPVKANAIPTPTTTVTTYTVPKRKATKPLQKAREMVGRANNIIEFFKAM